MAELRQLGGEVSSAAESLRNTIQKEAAEAESAFRAVGADATAVLDEARSAVEPAAAVADPAPAAETIAEAGTTVPAVDEQQLDLFADTHPPATQPVAAAAKPAESA